MQSEAGSGLHVVAPTPTELQLQTGTEAQPGQSEANTQVEEETQPQKSDMCKLPLHPPTSQSFYLFFLTLYH